MVPIVFYNKKSVCEGFTKSLCEGIKLNIFFSGYYSLADSYGPAPLSMTYNMEEETATMKYLFMGYLEAP